MQKLYNGLILANGPQMNGFAAFTVGIVAGMLYGKYSHILLAEFYKSMEVKQFDWSRECEPFKKDDDDDEKECTCKF